MIQFDHVSDPQLNPRTMAGLTSRPAWSEKPQMRNVALSLRLLLPLNHRVGLHAVAFHSSIGTSTLPVLVRRPHPRSPATA